MIEINADGANIKIEAHSRNLDDDWCRVRVHVQTNGFEGKTIAWLLEEDLRVFQKQLVLMMENLGTPSSARLYSAEPDLDIQLKMNRLGQIHGVFALESERRDGVPTVLSGSFEMDQTFLPPLDKQLQALLVQIKG